QVYRPSQTPHLTLSPERVAPGAPCGRALGARSESPSGLAPPPHRVSEKTIRVVVFHRRPGRPARRPRGGPADPGDPLAGSPGAGGPGGHPGGEGRHRSRGRGAPGRADPPRRRHPRLRGPSGRGAGEPGGTEGGEPHPPPRRPDRRRRGGPEGGRGRGATRAPGETPRGRRAEQARPRAPRARPRRPPQLGRSTGRARLASRVAAAADPRVPGTRRARTPDPDRTDQPPPGRPRDLEPPGADPPPAPHRRGGGGGRGARGGGREGRRGRDPRPQPPARPPRSPPPATAAVWPAERCGRGEARGAAGKGTRRGAGGGATGRRPAGERREGERRRLVQPRRAPSPASRPSPTDPALRANPYPEVTDPACRLPLPTLFQHARGCSPWRPAADMGTARREIYTLSPGFSRASESSPDAAGTATLSKARAPLSGRTHSRAALPFTKKRELSPGLPPASPGSVALPHWTPHGARLRHSGFGDLNPTPFRSAEGNGGHRPSLRNGARLSLRTD
uniref:Uncharacterized protein n=1 Tax=Monodelphis domestica TaxID=13616 RepID=A0A5F8GKP0_MONDO